MKVFNLMSRTSQVMTFVMVFFLSACFDKKENSAPQAPLTQPSQPQPSLPKPSLPEPSLPESSLPEPSLPINPSDPPKPPPGINAPTPIPKNITSQVLLSDPTSHTISLATSVEAQKDIEASLVSVTSLSADCPEPVAISPAQMTYTLTPDKPNICFYRYTVSNKALNGTTAESSADNHILMIEERNASKEPLSLPHLNIKNTENMPIEIDVIAELKKKNVNLSGKTLKEDILVFSDKMGITGGSAIVQPQNTILFSPDGTSSISRLIYTLLDPANTQYIDAGSIDILIEQANNTLPIANDFIYPTPVIMNQTTSINIAEHISDPDGDPVTLYSVSVFNALATLPKSDSSSCKTCFNFKANLQGQYKVNYLITDQREGFASGFVTINVNKPWKDIMLTTIEKNFSAMPDEMEAKEMKLSVSSYDHYPGNAQLRIPRLTFDAANAFCSERGMRLSKQNELVKLYQQRGSNLYINDGWPVSTPYWVSTDTQEAISLEKLKTVKSVKEAFFTCVNTDVIDITISPASVILKNHETVQLSAKTINETGNLGDSINPITWKSVNPKIASVDDNGLVTALSSGNVAISARIKNIMSQNFADISVYEISNVVISPTHSEEMLRNKVLQLSAAPVYMSNFVPDIPSPITWRSDLSNIVSVNANGLITSHNIGTALIYASIDGTESNKPLEIKVIENGTIVVGSKGVTSFYIDANVHPIISFSGHLFFEGVYTGNHRELIVGTRGQQQFPTNMNIKNLELLMAEKYSYDGSSGIARLEWTERNASSFYNAGLRNAAIVPAGNISVTESIKGLTVYLSADKNGKRTITGFRVLYF